MGGLTLWLAAYDCCIPVSRLTTAAYLCHGLRLLHTCVTALRLLYTCVTALRLTGAMPYTCGESEFRFPGRKFYFTNMFTNGKVSHKKYRLHSTLQCPQYKLADSVQQTFMHRHQLYILFSHSTLLSFHQNCQQYAQQMNER